MFDTLRENFEIILIVTLLLSAIAYAIYRLTFYRDIKVELAANQEHLRSLPKKEQKNIRHHITTRHLTTFFRKVVYFFADLFWVLLFVVVVRGFIYEPFIIPSGSMKPGLQIGDIVLVNKFELGLRMPISNQRLTKGRAIKRGDVLVFKYPGNPKISYIKRVIGLPGDNVFYDNRHLVINGQSVDMVQQAEVSETLELDSALGKIHQDREYALLEEDLSGNKHTIRYAKGYPANYPTREWKVPDGQYLMMGDNRDESADGRQFGFLNDALVIGHATRIAFNFECLKGNGQCNRFFKKIE